MSAVSNVVSSIVGGMAQSSAADSAAEAQAIAAQQAAQLASTSSTQAIQAQMGMWNESKNMFQPYLNAGVAGITALANIMPQFYADQVIPYIQKYQEYQTPTLPEFNYSFNEEDPVYQQKLAEANESIDKFLAKQGLQGSSAGEAFRQKQLEQLFTQEEERQYGRATDTYNRDLGSTLTQDQLDRQQLLSQYDMQNSMYGNIYGSMLDLAKIGTGSSAAAGSINTSTGGGLANTSLTTGNNLASYALGAGNAQAQSALTSGQAVAGVANSFADSATALGNYALSNYGGGYSAPQMYGYNGYYTSGPTGAFNVGQYGTTAYGM